MQPNPDLEGRTALVTGSAKRVGRELLLALGACGADVAVHYNESGAEAAATAEETREHGADATTVQADITDPASVDAAFDAVDFVAKTGVIMFTRMLASDTQDDGVTVNAVSPFAVENTVSDVSSLPRGRAAAFEDVAAPLLFFCSDAAGYISGENVAVDGGRLHEA